MVSPVARWALALGVSGAVAFVLLMPGEWVPTVSHVQELGLHAAVFAALTLAWTLVQPGARGRIALALAAVAAGTEALQAYVVPMRTGALDDLLANLTGIAVGALAGFLLTRRDRTKTPGLANETGR